MKKVLILANVFVVFIGCVTQGTPVFSPSGNALFPSSDEYLLFEKKGEVYSVDPYELIPSKPTKFNTIGAFTVTSSIKLDSNGNITQGSTITYEMLMKEVQKLKGDDFIHLRTDEIQRVKTSEEIIVQKYKDSNGMVRERERKVTVVSYTEIVFKASAIAIKYLPDNFSTINVIFASSEVKYNENFNIVSGSKITYEMLMNEVKKLGGDDFINLRIDEMQIIETTEGTFRRSSTNLSGEEVEWTYGGKLPFITGTEYKATAVAIKYNNVAKSVDNKEATNEENQNRSPNKR